MQLSLRPFVIDTRIRASDMTMDDCQKFLLDFINAYPQTTLVLDALDECKVQNRFKLMDVLDYLLAEASSPLKILISSRPDLDIKKRLKDRTNIQIQAQDNQEDITKFVNERISSHSSWHMIDLKLQEQIIMTLQDKSQGM